MAEYEVEPFKEDPAAPIIGRSGRFVGVALPEVGMQDRALMNATAAVRLGRELVRLGEILLTVEANVLDIERSERP